jgi:hypothetical protein
MVDAWRHERKRSAPRWIRFEGAFSQEQQLGRSVADLKLIEIA